MNSLRLERHSALTATCGDRSVCRETHAVLAITSSAVSVVERCGHLPFWRDPKRRFLVVGAADCADAVLALGRLQDYQPPGYRVDFFRASNLADGMHSVTLEFVPSAEFQD
jgi:hypothetical protein